MFIDTLEFTIPIDLCALYATLQEEAKSQLEFPASVNSYGTTQDANVQVALRANKVTFKVDGVSSNASIISKSECKTLKLSVFDVDRTLMQKNVNTNNSTPQVSFNSGAAKRLNEQSVSLPPAKNIRNSYGDSPRSRSPPHRPSNPQQSPRVSQNSNSKSHNDNPVNVKQEPEDPDLIEIEPDPEPDDIVPKKETPYMQIDYSSDIPHTQTSQAALDRVSFPPTSRSQSSSSSFHQNVPHVQDFAQPGTSQSQHSNQSADDFLVFQDDNDCNDDYEEADYGNDGVIDFGCLVEPGDMKTAAPSYGPPQKLISQSPKKLYPEPVNGKYPCPDCGKLFASHGSRWNHVTAVHNKVVHFCACGRSYSNAFNLRRHMRLCALYVNS